MDEVMNYRIIKAMQEGIPLERRPFKTLSEKIGTGEEELLKITHDLKEKKVIRQISPIFDTRMLGYDSALVAFKIGNGGLEHAAEAINAHPGVSHNYERGHEFNLWFTLAVPPDGRLTLEQTVMLIAAEAHALDYAILRPKRVFKICVNFDPKSTGLEKEEGKAVTHSFIPLDSEEREIVKVTQVDMPLIKRPFALYSDELGIGEDLVIDKLKEFEHRGVMRRFAAILNHRRVGFSANGMVVWKAPEDKMDEIGSKIAAFKAVTHCYERTCSGVWHYNLFSMVHGRSREEVEEIAGEIRNETSLKEYMILYSKKEFKKQRISYFSQNLYDWEEARLVFNE